MRFLISEVPLQTQVSRGKRHAEEACLPKGFRCDRIESGGVGGGREREEERDSVHCEVDVLRVCGLSRSVPADQPATYRGVSLIRKRPPPRTTTGSYAQGYCSVLV